MLFRICAVLCNFYPRPPRGGRPVCFAAGRVSVSISIHALRDEGYAQVLLPQNLFLSTPSARRATMLGQRFRLKLKKFLSTPSARRATSRPRRWAPPNNYFYPRPPRGGRPVQRQYVYQELYFYPRPPRGGRQLRFVVHCESSLFLSTPSARRATFRWLGFVRCV